MSEGSKETSPQQLAKSRRDYLAQVKMLTVDERTQEAAKIKAPAVIRPSRQATRTARMRSRLRSTLRPARSWSTDTSWLMILGKC